MKYISILYILILVERSSVELKYTGYLWWYNDSKTYLVISSTRNKNDFSHFFKSSPKHIVHGGERILLDQIVNYTPYCTPKGCYAHNVSFKMDRSIYGEL